MANNLHSYHRHTNREMDSQMENRLKEKSGSSL